MNAGSINRLANPIRLTRIDWLIFLSLLSLLLFFRFLVLFQFAIRYTDSDQSIMWLGLKNYSAGLFHEPCFYGQAYNSMMEAFFAVPLFLFGVPPYIALPIVTCIIALTPYIIISFFVFLKKSPELAFIILSIPLLLPIEYNMVTSLSRGFVTGIFISSFIFIGLFYVKSKVSFLLCSFLAVLGCILNFNSVLLSIPCLLFLFLENAKNKYFYLFSSMGLISGLFIYFFINRFYIMHPFYNLHKLDMSFSFELLTVSLLHLDKYLNGITPVFWKTGFLVMLIFVIISILLLRAKEYNKAIVVGLIPLLVILTLGISKVHDGVDSVFFSYSRMYLAIPILLGVSLSFLKGIVNTKYFYFSLLIPCFYFIYHTANLNKSIENNVSPKKLHVVAVMKTEEVLDQCKRLKIYCELYKIQLVIITKHFYYDFYDFGCPACIDSFPNTLRPIYERRTWRLIEDENKIYQNILIIDTERNFASEFGFVKKIEAEKNYFYIENNTKYTMDLLKSLGIQCRKYN